MYYVVKGSKCVHIMPDCKRSRVKNASRVAFGTGMRECKFCFPKKCMICFESGKHKCPCEEHNICEECLSNYVSKLIENPEWDQLVSCPCGKGNFKHHRLPHKIQEIIKKHIVTNDRCNYYKRSDLDVAIQDILTSKCQHCQSAFLDFDGCLSVQCRCKKYFCALCLHVDDTSEENHKHVLDCKLNPVNSYYLSFDKFQYIEHNRKCFNLWRFALNVFIESESVLYTAGLMLRINKYNETPLLPSMFKKYMWFFWLLFHIFLYHILGLKYIIYHFVCHLVVFGYKIYCLSINL